MVAASCRHNVARLRSYAGRALYVQAFARLYHAFQELLELGERLVQLLVQLLATWATAA